MAADRAHASCRLLACLLPLCAAPVCAQQAGSITGSVTDHRTAEPLEGVTVLVTGTLFVAVTDAGGAFVIESVPARVYMVAAMAPDYREERREVTVRAAQAVHLAIRLRAADHAIHDHPDAAAFFARPARPRLLRSRRGGADFVPVVRGLLGRRIGVFVNGERRLSGSPYGFGLLAAMPPGARIEVVPGPYILVEGPGVLSAVRIRNGEGAERDLGLERSAHAWKASGFAGRGSAWHAFGLLLSRSDHRDGAGRSVDGEARIVSLGGRAAVRLGSSARLELQADVADASDLDAAGSHARGGGWERHGAQSRLQKSWGRGVLRAVEFTASHRRLTHVVGQLSRPDTGRLTSGEAERSSARLLTRWAPGTSWTLRAGADFHDVRHRAAPLEDGARIAHGGVFAQAERRAGEVETSAGLRLDFVRAGAVKETAPGGVLAVRMPLAAVWTLAAGFGSQARTASVWERFAVRLPNERRPFGVRVRGSRTLRPERHTQADLRLQGAWSKFSIDASGFVARISGYVTPQETGRLTNGVARFSGLEAWARHALFGRSSEAYGGAVIVRGTPRDNLRPAAVFAGLHLAAPGDIAAFDAEVYASAGREGHAVLDLRLGISLPRSLTLVLGAENVTGALYVDPIGAAVPEPGRVFSVRLGHRR